MSSTGHLKRSSSDYLLLTHNTNGDAQDIAIPRPKAFYLVPGFGALDLLCALVFTVLIVIHRIKGAVFLLLWNYARASIVLHIGLHPRIRERAFLIALTSIVRSPTYDPGCSLTQT